MNVESMLIYGLTAVGGWLLRHYGFGAAIKTPGLAPANRIPIMATLKADIDQIVKSAVEAAVKQALDEIKGSAVPQKF